MEQILKKVLKKIENNGYEAYLVGGYVRDMVLGKKTYDIDICTNALPKELNKIFPNCINNNYGGISFKLKKYNFDITTYRKEISYKNRKPVEIEYINNLLDDISRRDFKINALCLNSKGFIIDLINGMEDINNRLIDTIGYANDKFQEDPLRMLRAIRFSAILDFELSEEVYDAIEENKHLLLNIPFNRIKDEFDKILVNHNALKGLELLKHFGILELFHIEYQNIKKVNDCLGMWAQLGMEFNSSFTKEEKNTIINIRKIVELKKIDKKTLFDYGLYQCLVAGEILGADKTFVNRLYKQMPIYNKKDVAIKAEEIISILGIEPGDILSVVINDVIDEILKGKLKNNNQQIKKFIHDRKEFWLK